MPLTRRFVDTVRDRATQDPAFRAALFEEALQALLDGDMDGAKELLRDCINATIGFQALSERSGLPIKSVMRMVSGSGNPRLNNFVSLLSILQEASGMHAAVSVIHEMSGSFAAIRSSSSKDNFYLDNIQTVEV